MRKALLFLLLGLTSLFIIPSSQNVNAAACGDDIPRLTISRSSNSPIHPGSTVSIPYPLVGTIERNDFFDAIDGKRAVFNYYNSDGSFVSSSNVELTSQSGLGRSNNITLTVPPNTPAGTALQIGVSVESSSSVCEASNFISFTVEAAPTPTPTPTFTPTPTPVPVNNSTPIGAPFTTDSIEYKIFPVPLTNTTDPVPFTAIDTSNYAVRIEFYNMPDDLEYFFCLRTNQDDCVDEEEFIDDGDLQGGKSGNAVIFPEVCGDGNNKVKTRDIGGCREDKDYFHPGNIYRVGVYAGSHEDPTLIAMAEMYVFHFYPVISIADGLTLEKDRDYHKLNSTVRPLKHSLLSYIKKTSLDGNPSNDETDDTCEPSLTPLSGCSSIVRVKNPISLLLGGYLKAVGSKGNNYQVVIEGIDNNYGNKRGDDQRQTGEGCITINKDTQKSEMIQPSGSSSLKKGKYVIKISEQINEDTYRTVRTDKCQGGFTYYRIPFTVKQLKPGGPIEAFININEVEIDPNKSELQDILDDKNLALPCSRWEGKLPGYTGEIDEDDRCAEYETAFGTFFTKPTAFIGSVGRWMLGIGIVAGFAFLIYAGYLFMLSRGDKEKISHAREVLTTSVTGLIFLILSLAILEIIGVDILQIPGFTR